MTIVAYVVTVGLAIFGIVSFIGSSSGRGACPGSRTLWASVGTVGWQSPRVGYTQLGLAYCGRGFDTTCGTWPELCGDWVSRADGGRRSYSDVKADDGSRDVGDRYLGYCSRNNSKPCPLVLVGSGARDLQPTPASSFAVGARNPYWLRRADPDVGPSPYRRNFAELTEAVPVRLPESRGQGKYEADSGRGSCDGKEGEP